MTGDISIQNTTKSDDDGSTLATTGGVVGRSVDIFVLKSTYEAGFSELSSLASAGVESKHATDWESENPALQQGVIGYDITNKRLKVGDGFNNWNDLQYIEEPAMNEIRIEYGNYESFRTNLETTII